MRGNISTRLTRLIVVTRENIEEAKALIRSQPDIDVDRIVYAITGVPCGQGRGPEYWLAAARGENYSGPCTSRIGE
jgi:hypothetical protein